MLRTPTLFQKHANEVIQVEFIICNWSFIKPAPVKKEKMKRSWEVNDGFLENDCAVGAGTTY